MSVPLAVKTEGISKRYQLGQRAHYGRLTESVAATFVRAIRRRGKTDEDSGFFWALKDVSLEIERGQVLGIIGRNGAGKSTLLKILSRITWPTEGHAEVVGKVGSLLEVGTGFHPELTGRENVYLNGAILGMKRAEIDQKFDAIIEFAEIDRFVDTAVKFYSSGMKVRLAFAIAAFLEAEVLFVDEVLAVGDYRFQRKCLETMRHVGETGQTVILVSHNLAAIRAFCNSCVVLDHGRVIGIGGTDACVQQYVTMMSNDDTQLDVDVSMHNRPVGQGSALRFTRVRLDADPESGKLLRGEPIRVDLEFDVTREVSDVAIGFSIYSIDGTWILQCLNVHSGPPYERLTPGRYAVRAVVAENDLVGGRYVLGVGSRSGSEGLDWVQEPIQFEVVESERASWWLDPGSAGLIQPRSSFGPPQALEWPEPRGLDSAIRTREPRS